MGVGTLKRAVFLDRDGVINRHVYYEDSREWESPRTSEALELLPGVIEAIHELQDAGYLIFLVSNQPSYAKGKCLLEDLKSVHHKLETMKLGLTESYYCYHHPQGIVAGYSGSCPCRKPSPYFLLQAKEKYGLDMANSWMVGDRNTDIECGKAAGVQTIQVQKDYEWDKVSSNFLRGLPEASALILKYLK